jgi:hypothetical protein
MIKGNTRNNFWRRFRLKVKTSAKVYGKKDRRQNKVNPKQEN